MARVTGRRSGLGLICLVRMKRMVALIRRGKILVENLSDRSVLQRRRTGKLRTRATRVIRLMIARGV